MSEHRTERLYGPDTWAARMAATDRKRKRADAVCSAVLILLGCALVVLFVWVWPWSDHQVYSSGDGKGGHTRSGR